MKQLILLSFLVLISQTNISLAAGLFDSKCIDQMMCLTGNCASHADAKIRHLSSGQNGDLMAKLDKAVNQIYKEIAPRLGLIIPNTTITHLSATDMAALAMNSGHPMPHWIDGKNVLEGAKSAAGIYEFVTPGVNEHHQFIRDTNTFHETLLVLAHVAGHYDFAEVTPFFKQRSSNQVEASIDLAKYMIGIRQTEDVNEVSEWYHKLNTLASLQDLSRGSYTSADRFLPENNRGKKIPSSPNESVLQAFISNLPQDIAPWKKTMAEKYEKLHRSIGGYYQTKIMNEGWATMMEYIVLRHSEWRTSADATEFGQINAGVVTPRIDNPYWLGLEAWNHLYKKFKQHPQMQSLSEIDQDARFIKYAHEIIKGHTDYSFVRMAFDSRWVDKSRLILFKQEDIYDFQQGELEQKRIVSRDGDRVIDYIANSVANKDFRAPKIELHDLNYDKTGVVILKHNVVEGIPLNPRTLAQALYSISNIIGAKIKLETIAVETWNFFVNKKIKRIDIPYPPYHYEYEVFNPSPFHYEKMIIEVSPSGEVKVIIDHPSDASQKAQAYFQSKIDAFKDDINLTYEGKKLSSKLDEIQTMNAQGAVDAVNSLKRHAPTAAQAVLEYFEMIKSRMEKILKLSVTGKSPVKFTANGAMIKLLPEVPEIQLDFMTLEKRRKFLESDNKLSLIQKFDPSFSFSAPSIKFNKEVRPLPDEDLDIGKGDGVPGDIIDRKPKDKNGQGDGDPQDGDPQDGEPGTKPGPGDDPRDPSYEEVPLDVYGRALAQEIKLRNLRRTQGANERNDDLLIGAERKAYGDVLIDRTAIEAFSYGKALEIIERRKNKNAKPKTAHELLKDGFKNLPEEEQRVRSREPEPEPDFDAVVVFVADTSASMRQEERFIERLMVRNQVALLKAQYKRVKIHYVIYGGSAREVSEKEFFTTFMNDGTETVTGIVKAREILKKYPRNKFNRFVQVFSDGDDFNTQKAIAEARELANEVEYFTYGAVHGTFRAQWGNQLGELSQEFAKLEKEQPKLFGFAILVKSQQSIFEAIKKWFGKN